MKKKRYLRIFGVDEKLEISAEENWEDEAGEEEEVETDLLGVEGSEGTSLGLNRKFFNLFKD
jgi:hypothetical protein